MITFRDVGECLSRVSQIFQDVLYGKYRDLLSFEYKGVVFKEGPAAAETGVAVRVITQDTFSVREYRVVDVLDNDLLIVDPVHMTVRTGRLTVQQFDINDRGSVFIGRDIERLDLIRLQVKEFQYRIFDLFGNTHDITSLVLARDSRKEMKEERARASEEEISMTLPISSAEIAE